MIDLGVMVSCEKILDIAKKERVDNQALAGYAFVKGAPNEVFKAHHH